MPKKVSDIQKKEMIDGFIHGKTIDELSEEYSCTKITITRHLKEGISKDKYKQLTSKKNNPPSTFQECLNENKIYESESNREFKGIELNTDQISIDSSFIEITPLDYEIDNNIQKDLSSIPISDIVFPKVVFMIVDKKIELETKYLREYPDWHFLSEEELNRKTIEIYFDLKKAKRFCNKEQKVIKVPNTCVFKIVAPLLLAKGISRIVSADQLIAL